MEKSKVLYGRNNPFYGRTHTKETKKRLREQALQKNLSGVNNPFYGEKHTNETRQKMRAYWKKRREENEDS